MVSTYFFKRIYLLRRSCLFKVKKSKINPQAPTYCIPRLNNDLKIASAFCTCAREGPDNIGATVGGHNEDAAGGPPNHQVQADQNHHQHHRQEQWPLHSLEQSGHLSKSREYYVVVCYVCRDGS
jgi:hypothetical protein